MSHFARINGLTKLVDKVERIDVDVAATLPDYDMWIQCSYNTRGGVHYDPETGSPSADQSKALRKNYPGIGWTYDLDKDAFIPPKPFDSWTLNETTCLWEAPTARPETGMHYWDEETTSWIEGELMDPDFTPDPE